MKAAPPSVPALSVVIPTMGREILIRTLESLADAELADLEKKYAQAGASDAPPVQPTKPRP